MNIITGSSGGLGMSLYQLFIDNDLPVIGIDQVDSKTCDLIFDFSDKNLSELFTKLNSVKIDSITFCHAIGNSKQEIEDHSLEEYIRINSTSVLDLLNFFKPKCDENSSIIFISSVHSSATNNQSNKYALSKNFLEGIYRMLIHENIIFNISLIRLGAVNTQMLKKNVSDVKALEKNIPSGKILQPDQVTSLIFDIHTKHADLLNKAILQVDGGVLLKLATD